MREFLFKGFEKEFVPLKCAEAISLNGKEIRGAWVEGNLHVVYKEDGSSFMAISACDVPGGYIRVIPETVSEYTGLCDRNGKKIFKNNVFRCFYDEDDTEDLIVDWEADKCRYIAKLIENPNDIYRDFETLLSKKGAYYGFGSFFAERCEVIGDIFNTRVLEHD